MVSIFEPYSKVILALLILDALWAFVSSLELLKENFELANARRVFWKINAAFLLTVILLSIDEYLKHHIA
jgi:hypothetical protein